MKTGKKWSLYSALLKMQHIVPVKYEEELTLHFSRDELFDRHVILPHAEVNPLVYDTVDRFTERYGGNRLKLVIYCNSITEYSQQFFREAFVSHYEDEYRRVTLYLYRWYVRVIALAAVSILAYYIGSYLSAGSENMNFLLYAISNIGIYCLWEICNTDFKRKDTVAERKKIIRARDAEISFR